MKFILYALLIIVVFTLLVMIFNRLYFEFTLGRSIQTLNKQLKKAMKEQVDDFSRELKDVLSKTINAMTDSYDELINELKTKEN